MRVANEIVYVIPPTAHSKRMRVYMSYTGVGNRHSVLTPTWGAGQTPMTIRTTPARRDQTITASACVPFNHTRLTVIVSLCSRSPALPRVLDQTPMTTNPGVR